MHQSSFAIMKQFRAVAQEYFPAGQLKVLDIGSYGVNGTYKDLFAEAERFKYTGLDTNTGPNVDIVPKDPYQWAEIADGSFDIVVSGQAFEHIEFPWLTIAEVKRVVRPGGLVCLIAPSRGPEHRYPLDCWRYYPDGFRALAKWAGLHVMETQTTWGKSGFDDGSDQWGDTVGIFMRP